MLLFCEAWFHIAFPVCFLLLWQTPLPKATCQVNRLFGQLVTSPRKNSTKTQGKNLEARTEVERSATYWLVFPDGTPHHRLDSLTSISRQVYSPQTCSSDNFKKKISSTEISSSQICLSPCQVYKSDPALWCIGFHLTLSYCLAKYPFKCEIFSMI